MPAKESARPNEFLVAEYEAATSAYLHYDSFRWQSGSLLIAGAFVFLGFLASGGASTVVDFGALAVTFVMSVWLLYAQHHRTLYLFKLHRISELEVIMGAEQNLRFRGGSAVSRNYPRIGIPGHILDRIMASGISVIGAVLSLLKASAGVFTILALLLAASTLVWVLAQDARARAAVHSREALIG